MVAVHIVVVHVLVDVVAIVYVAVVVVVVVCVGKDKAGVKGVRLDSFLTVC